MIILGIITQCTRPGQKRAKGRDVTERWGIGVDSYNLTLCYQVDAKPWIAKLFYYKFEHMMSKLEEMGIDVDNSSRVVSQALNHLFGKEQKPKSFLEIDSEFSVGKCLKNSSGMKQISIDVRAKMGIDGDEAEEESPDASEPVEEAPQKRGRRAMGDLIVEVPDFPGKAVPQNKCLDDEEE